MTIIEERLNAAVAARDRSITEAVARPGRDALAEAAFERALELYRRELTGYCYRLLGSWDEAEDAVQDAFLRAWRSVDAFEGRAQLRSWLYKIATNVCLTMLDGRRRRALPMDLEGPSSSDAILGGRLPDGAWIQPIADRLAIGPSSDPAELAASRDTIRLAFIAALQLLSPRQRAVLILRDVLRWRASEVAELLDATVVSVNGLLRRARATLASRDLAAPPAAQDGERDTELLARYVEAFERLDVDTLVELLHEDATLAMPPYTVWLQGPRSITAWLVANACGGSRRLPIEMNGSTAFAVYKPTSHDGTCEPFAIEIIEVAEHRITAIHAFIESSLFARLGLPPTLPKFADQLRTAAIPDSTTERHGR